jgi:hypothetical protein
MRVTWFASRAFMFAALICLLSPTPAAAQQRNAIRVGGIAGNHPYFYRGSIGQSWANHHPVGYPAKVPQFRNIRVIRNPWWYGYGYGNYYDYGYGGWGYPSQTYYIERPVVQSAPRVYVPPPPRDGWSLLTTGEYDAARGRFAIEAQQGSARANVGYALASALAGRHGDAAWAMRKALNQDALALGSVPPELRPRLDALAGDYNSGAAKLIFGDDRWFMTAAIEYLRGNSDAARAALARAKDGDKSTKNLRGVVGK